MTVRTRFAPSPTGHIHLGNARVAVFNWLFTRHHGGAFVLRVEDTDVERNVEGAEATLMEDLRWLGLDWDEGPDAGGERGPYRQSERTELYRQAARTLLDEGLAYACYCTDEELAAEAEEVGGREVARYSGRCRDLAQEERGALEREGRTPAIRFRLPDGDEVHVNDEIRGTISFPMSDFDDFIIVRRDGRPTYNFAVVVDDILMEITHVIRGAGHLSNTPKQALLFEAMDRPQPAFAHLPMVLAPGGGKLSKRKGAASVDELRDQGLHPDGVVNYLSLLGWSSADEQEVLSRSELVERIGLDRVGAADTTFDPEKLRWVSGQHIASMELDDLVDAVEPFVRRAGMPLEGDTLRWAVEALRSRLSTFGDIEEHLRRFVFPEPGPSLRAARRQVREDAEARRVIETALEVFGEVDAWVPDAVLQAIRDVGEAAEVGGAGLYHPIRKAVTGNESGPDVGRVLAALGRDETLDRLRKTLEQRGV